ncbi:MAG TPA: GGDEF domain-containing protein, partial [Phenylobacterium sp.]
MNHASDLPAARCGSRGRSRTGGSPVGCQDGPGLSHRWSRPTRLISQLDTTPSELREHEARLRHQALFDGLTGLANRTHFHEEATATLAAAAPGTVSLLLIDLDGFKGVKDTLGHAAGDALLKGVAAKLSASVRGCDLVARLGGDEFAVLLRDCAADDADNTSRRILAALT